MANVQSRTTAAASPCGRSPAAARRPRGCALPRASRRASRLQSEQTTERPRHTCEAGRRHASHAHPLLRPPVSAHSPSPRHETRPASPLGCALPRLAARGARGEQSKRRRSAAAEGRTHALPVAEGACARPAGRHTGNVPRRAARERGRWPARRAQQRWCDMRRTLSFALAVACVISGRTSASGRLYVSGSRSNLSRRLIRSRVVDRVRRAAGGTDAAWYQQGPWSARHGGG